MEVILFHRVERDDGGGDSPVGQPFDLPDLDQRDQFGGGPRNRRLPRLKGELVRDAGREDLAQVVVGEHRHPPHRVHGVGAGQHLAGRGEDGGGGFLIDLGVVRDRRVRRGRWFAGPGQGGEFVQRRRGHGAESGIDRVAARAGQDRIDPGLDEPG